MEAFLDRVGEGLTPLFDRYDALRDKAQERLDRTAGGPLRTWLKPVLLAFAVTVGVVALLRLLLTALTGAGGVGRWIGAAVAGALAIVLLVVVIRNVVISLVEPAQRRLLLLALLTSAAAVLTGVEAFAAVTVALADHVPLWTVERFYLWQLVGSVPLLEIPGRLGWTEPPVLPGLTGRLLVLGFALTVIPPLIRVGVALYGYVEGQAQQRRYTTALAGRLRGPGPYAGESDVPWVLALAAGAGAVWSVLRPHGHPGMEILSLATVAFVVTVVAVLAAAAMVAGFHVYQLVQTPGWVTLAAVAGLVWLDSPARRALVPAVAGYGFWGKVWVTLGLWLLALLLVVVCVWSDPEFADAVVALALVLGFVGPDAPAGRWLLEHLAWRPWGFPVGPPVVAACGWFTVAFLLRMLWSAVRRPPVLGQSDMLDTASGLRQDLRGYALVAGQIVISAGAALALLRTIDAVDLVAAAGDRWTPATRSVTAAAWHVVDSLPGPDVPGILGWRLTADVSGPWAGLVIIVAVAAVIVFAGLPILRTVVLWARLTAGRPRTGEALIGTPATVAANLRAVVEFLEGEAARTPLSFGHTHRRAWPFYGMPVKRGAPSLAAERRLVKAELDRQRLVDVFGNPSTWYTIADRALSRTADAYRAWVKGRTDRRIDAGELAGKVAAAREALDAYADAIDRWFGADPVTSAAAAAAGTDATPDDRRAVAD